MARRIFDFPNALGERAVDGDSIDVTVYWENPFYIGPTPMPIRLRLAGIDCDASTGAKATERGRAAKARTAELTEGKRLHVQTFEPYDYKAPRGRLGEWVGDVFVMTPPEWTLPQRPIRLSQMLLAEGLAVPYDGKGKRPSAASRMLRDDDPPDPQDVLR